MFAPEFGVKDGGLALPKGVIAGVSIEAFFRVLTEPAMGINDFDKLPIPFRAMATDIETGESVVLDRGSVAQAMRASMSVPGAIAPVEIDGRLLVDGGIANNLPIDAGAQAVRRRRDRRQHLHAADEAQGPHLGAVDRRPADQLSRQADGRRAAEEHGQRRRADRTRPGGYLGEQLCAIPATPSASARRRRARWRRRSRATACRRSSTRRCGATQIADAESLGTVDEIRFEGLERTNPEVLRGLVRSKPGEPLTEEKVGADLRRIYGRGDFESVGYHILGDGGPRAMVITPREKSWGPDFLRFGLGLESDFQGDNAFNCSSSTAGPGSTGWAASG